MNILPKKYYISAKDSRMNYIYIKILLKIYQKFLLSYGRESVSNAQKYYFITVINMSKVTTLPHEQISRLRDRILLPYRHF